ncbi:proline-rich protein 36-like [Cucumis melo var. makuwa]|uniref:Proline-rich protein 36-like n=1 Tax=Cucumis melo var. makuwa TaxID=1194695 RepID=A0A5D3C8U8_CUCMM|nr:proline-rich protein 36-like [Cucumis melo var. makuwa]
MSYFRVHAWWAVVMVMLVVMGEGTPPGIANNPSHATCKIKKYKHCYNLVHVCPKFCPNQCHVECASCKPICGSGGDDANPPPEDNTPAPPSKTYYSPPPPVAVTPSPPASNPSPSHSPPLPSPTPTPVTPSPSPPPPYSETPSTPPTISPPPPVTSTPPPANTNPPKSPPTNQTPSPPPPTDTKPPSNPTPPTVSPPPPVTSTPPSENPNPPTSPPTNHPPSTPPANPTPPENSNPPSTPPTNPNTPSTPPSTPNYPSPTPPSETPNSPPVNTPTSPPQTPSPPASNPPSSSAGATKTVRCKNVNYPQCYNMIHNCPSACPNGCQVDCVTCKPVCHCDRPGAVCQDPRLVGGDGITFYFHGKKDKDFCLVSDPNLHINAHFIGKRNPSLKRDFTWVQSLAILFNNHRLLIAAQKTDVWDDSIDRLTIVLDDHPMALPISEGSQIQHPIENPTITIVRLAATNHVMVEAKGLFRITAKVVPITKEDSRIHNYGIEEGDSFAHLDVGFKFFGLSDDVNGVLGQTYGAGYVSSINVKAAMAVMGRGEEFETSSLFAADCAVSRFGGNGGVGGGDETI